MYAVKFCVQRFGIYPSPSHYFSHLTFLVILAPWTMNFYGSLLPQNFTQIYVHLLHFAPSDHFSSFYQLQLANFPYNILYRRPCDQLMRTRRHKIQSQVRHNLSLIPQRDSHLESTSQVHKDEKQHHSELYNKIKGMVSQSSRKPDKTEAEEKVANTQFRSYRVLVRSEQQKQLMGYLNPRVLPVLVGSPPGNKKKKGRSQSVLDNILGDRQKFMKTYFADIKHHRKSGDRDQISYIFPQVRDRGWQISGFMKGKYILLKGQSKKRKSVLKKYLYSDVCVLVRKDYQRWAKDRFVAEIEELA